MIIERMMDPTESVFRMVMKVMKRDGKSHPAIEKSIRDLVLKKLQSELTFQEFKDLFIILFCKTVNTQPI